MLRAEKNIIEWLLKHSWILAFIAVTILSGIARYYGRTFVSADMENYLLPWFNQMQETGFKGLSEPMGNYNILYQEIMLLLTLIPWNPVFMIKCVSILFDYLLALTVAVLVCQVKEKEYDSIDFVVAYTVVLFLPTVVLNSAFWGQCDSIYVYFTVLSVLLLYKKRYKSAFIFLGIAFAFKVQTIFILPFVIYLYVLKKEFSILNFLWSVFSFWACGIPAYIAGRSIFGAFEAYISQVGESTTIYIHVPSFWVLVGGDYDRLSHYAIAITIALLGVGLVVLHKCKSTFSNKIDFFACVVLTVWTCTLFLCGMHERYNYMLDIFLVILCIINAKYMPFAAMSALFSLLGYSIVLYPDAGGNDLTYADSVIALFMWLYFSYKYFKKQKKMSENGRQF